jgi:SET domain-containing protein 6
MDAEELEEYFTIERDSGEPDCEGRLTHDVKLYKISQELDEQLRNFIKVLPNSNASVIVDKRKRGDICNAAVSQALMAKLKQYSTSVEEDETLLKEENLSRRLGMAIAVRVGEKKLLQEAIALMQGGTNTKEEADGERATKKARTNA